MFERFASWATRWSGSTTAFMLAAASIVLWLVTGPMFHWSDTWQLVANTVTTVITFMMVFLIQRTQNKDSLAIQIKLNEQMDIFKEFVGDLRDRDIVNIQLVSLYKEEKKIERAFECRQLNFVTQLRAGLKLFKIPRKIYISRLNVKHLKQFLKEISIILCL